MSSDIISILNLDKDNSQGQVILVKEINGCDSSFINSCIIGHKIKSKSYILVVTFHNTLVHYQNVGLKMNYNINKCIDTKLVDFYSAGENIVNNCVFGDTKLSLDDVFMEIKEKCNVLLQKQSSISVILEGIAHLFDLQYSLREVNSFVRNVVDYIRNMDNSFVLFQFNVANDEDITNLMSNLLSHIATTVVEVVNLSTGLSADISGHLILKHPGDKFKPDNVSVMDLKPSCYHFKLFDRGVKLFAPGVL